MSPPLFLNIKCKPVYIWTSFAIHVFTKYLYIFIDKNILTKMCENLMKKFSGSGGLWGLVRISIIKKQDHRQTLSIIPESLKFYLQLLLEKLRVQNGRLKFIKSSKSKTGNEIISPFFLISRTFVALSAL